MFGSNRIDTFYCRKDAQGFTVSAYCQIFLFHVAGRVQYEAGNLEVRETKNFSFAHHVSRNIFHLIICRQFCLVVNNVLQLAEEPRIDLSQFVDAVDGISFFHSLCDREDTQVCRT